MPGHRPFADFLSALEAVYQLEFVVRLNNDLRWLAEALDTWRERKRDRLGAWLATLPSDDPFLCPVSLLGATGQGRLEPAHTRTLAWLLDPREEHGFGDALLRALLGRLSGVPLADSFAVDWVEGEYPALGEGEDGFLDVVAAGGGSAPWLLVVEAKSDHVEGPGQLAKYDVWVATHYSDHQVLRVFLTPDGRAATTGSEDWPALSFLELVNVLGACLPDLAATPGYHLLRFYLAGVLRDVCGCPLPTPDCRDPHTLLKYLAAIHDQRGGPHQ
jgi:hypothetical protein